jgi:hypothetical protein
VSEVRPPDYLMDDEAGADRRFDAYLHPVT